jgi:7-carboxy-7-deazaguanine synthase
LAPRINPDLTLQVSETFYSIQGESSYSGYPCFFIRLTGCNLRCTWCDTTYAYEEPGKEVSIKELLLMTAAYPAAFVEITGGEPLLQENVYPLIDSLLNASRKILVETNGSLSLDRLDSRVVKIMDVKCPSSKMHEQVKTDNFKYLTRTDEVKFVIASRDDYEWACDLVGEYLCNSPIQIAFSPAADLLEPAELAAWILADHLTVRLQVQMHRILWPLKHRGV